MVAEHNALGYSGTNAGGNLQIVRSVWRRNWAGIVPNTLDSELLPPFRQVDIVGNLVEANHNRDAPGVPLEWATFGNGILLAFNGGFWKRPDRVFDGVVSNMDSRVDPVTRSVTVRADLTNAEGLLRQGMFMTVTLRGEETPTLLVPEEALVPERGRAYVFVVVDNVVERREVTTGKRRPGVVEIVTGIAEHERVVVDGTQSVRDGSVVQESPPGAS